jgi:hypothetical protein
MTKDASIPRQAERLGPEELGAFAKHVEYLVGLQCSPMRADTK